MKLVFAPLRVAGDEEEDEAAVAQRKLDMFANQWTYPVDKFVIIRPDFDDDDNTEPWWCAKIKSDKFKDDADGMWKCRVLWYNKDGDVYKPHYLAPGPGVTKQGWGSVFLEAVQDKVSMTRKAGGKHEKTTTYRLANNDGTRAQVLHWAARFHEDEAARRASLLDE